MTKIISIDFGTKNSVVAVMNGNTPVLVPNAEGDHFCPSVVAFTKNGGLLIGQAAEQQAMGNPENTIVSVKPLLGRRIDEAETRRIGDRVAYQIVADPAGNVQIYVPVLKRSYTPTEIAAIILRKLKQDAEAYLGQPVSEAVMAIPLYFEDKQRQAMIEAGYLAGLEVLSLVAEPVAAVLACRLPDRQQKQTVLVIDLGSSHYSVSVLELSPEVLAVKAADNICLGGDDWDECIVSWLADRFKQETGLDLRCDRLAQHRLRAAAERAKIELSSLPETEINLPFITADVHGPKHLRLSLSRAKFEQLTGDLVERCHRSIDQVLRRVELSPEAVDEVILVGGASRVPKVREQVQAITDKIPPLSLNPDEAAAVGIAIHSQIFEVAAYNDPDPFSSLEWLLSKTAKKFARPFGILFGLEGFQSSRNLDQETRPTATLQSDDDNAQTVRITLIEAFYGTTRTVRRTDGGQVEVKIPPGIHNGWRIRLSDPSAIKAGSSASELDLKIEVASDPDFQREADDLRVTVLIDLYTALLGGQIEVSTIDRTVILTIPPETADGMVFRLHGLGMPQMHKPTQRGNLYVRVKIQWPHNLSETEKELFHKLQALYQREIRNASKNGSMSR